MKVKLLFFTTLIAMCGCHSNGQQKAKIQTSNTSSSSGSLSAGATEIIQHYSEKSYSNLKAGDIAPDAVKLDVDQIVALVNGTCLVRKGNSEALIDVNGKIIVPWGKYQFDYNPYTDFYFSTLINVKDPTSGNHGFINTKGQVVVPVQHRSVSAFRPINVAAIETKEFKTIYIDTKGKIIPTFNYLLNSDDTEMYYERQIPNLFIYRTNATAPPNHDGSTNDGPPVVGYATMQKKVVIPVRYLDGHEFSEGLAAVAKADEFGFVKWGFINEAGKQVIPFMFENTPGDFHNGLALVKPASKDKKFDYAYIDKQGNVKITIGIGDNSPPYYTTVYHRHNLTSDPTDYKSSRFTNGYAFWQTIKGEMFMLDTLGSFHKLSDISKSKNLEVDDTGLFIKGYDRLGMYFYATHRYTAGINTQGLMDYKGNLIYPPFFANIIPDYYSPYAFAEIAGVNSNAPTKKGIINHQGIFVLVVQEKSKF